MEYRDQLKYIKTHQEERRPDRGRRRKKKRGRISVNISIEAG